MSVLQVLFMRPFDKCCSVTGRLRKSHPTSGKIKMVPVLGAKMCSQWGGESFFLSKLFNFVEFSHL